MRIHLVTYATPRFRHRQLILGWSARANRVVDTVTNWTPKKLLAAGFEDRCKGIFLSERGSGFWAWKPFIIDAKLREVPEGDLVFYCDVGRRFPYKILDRPLNPFLDWMEQNHQEFMPGLKISYWGPLSMWTKRDAFVFTGMDNPDAHSAPSVQASFSLWRRGSASHDFIHTWMELCLDRRLISDDPSTCGLPELPDFHENRHDQSLLTLCCLKHKIKAFEVGDSPLPVDTRDPSQVSEHLLLADPVSPSLVCKLFSSVVKLIEYTEGILRRSIKFGLDMPAQPNAKG
jgi:hypothetical protein